MFTSIRNFFLRHNVVTAIYALVAIVASLHLYIISKHVAVAPPYTDYNNYVIFKQSYFHLLAGKNLYIEHLTEQWDLYKYSPTFALAMGLLAHIPDVVALPIWNLLNALTLYVAIRSLPYTNRVQTLMLWFILLELLTSMQNTQSNGLMAALMIGTYTNLRSGKTGWAALWATIAIFIKVYGGIVCCLFLFFPHKGKFVWSCIGWGILLAVLPLCVISPQELVWQYKNWATMMAADQVASYGYSVMGWLHSWFMIDGGRGLVTITGVILFAIPFLRVNMYKNEVYRLMMLSFALIWVIIFNAKAESPTFILAISGVAIWYYARRRSPWYIALMIIMFAGTSLTHTDLFSHNMRKYFLFPYVIKAVPSILMFVVIFIELMLMKPHQQLPPNTDDSLQSI